MFNLFFDNSPSPYIIIDKKLNILNFNKTANRYFNFKESNNNLISHINKKFVVNFINWIESNTYVNKDIEIDLECSLNNENTTKRFKIKSTNHPDFINIIFLYFIDIQDEYNHKFKLELELNNQIEQGKLKNEILIYQSKLSEMGETIQNIAHQWRQPLNHISTTIMNLEYKIYEENLTNDYLLTQLKDIDQITNNLSNILDDFLRFFRSDAVKRKFNLVDLYKDIIKFSNYRLAKKNNISIIYDKTDFYLKSYKNELIQVLLILVNNSIDAIDNSQIEDKFIITINHYVENNFSFIEIHDNAGGIDEKIINKIWEPYFSTKEKEKGVGIGLYIVKVIIENHLNGIASVESKNGKTKFTIKIPYTEAIFE